MNLNKETKDDTMIVSVLDPRIDASTAVDLKAQICEVIDEGQHELVLDLSRVDFIDSSGIGAIVGILKYLGRRGSFAIAGLSKKAEQVFRLTKMDKVFRLYPSVDDALGAS